MTNPWKTNKTWTNLTEKDITRARDTNGQQIPEASLDVTSLVFPAMGAILILLFGGFLLSSGQSCCHVTSNSKKKNNVENEGIEFGFIDDSFFPKPFPVLQQENNDVVEAVMETYSDLPQYAPINELIASMPGIITQQPIIAKQPETRDACLSPIHDIDHVGMYPSNDDDVQHSIDHVGMYPGNDDDVQHNIDHVDMYPGNDDDVQQSHVDRYPGNDDVHTTIEEEYRPNMEDDDVNEVEYCSILNASSGIGTCSRENTPAMSSLSVDYNENVVEHCSGISADNMRTMDVSLKNHIREVQRTLNTSRDKDEAETKELHEKSFADKHIPLTRFVVEKWINDAKASCDGQPPSPYQWKRPGKLTNKDKLEILKRLQPNFDTTMNKTGNIKSDVNIPNKDIQQSACAYVHNSDTPIRNVGGYIINTKGGRLSRLKVVRAPSSMCIHGNLCRDQCKSNHVTTNIEDCSQDDSGRGASWLGLSSRGSLATETGAKSSADPTREASCLGVSSRGSATTQRQACSTDEQTRGACASIASNRGASVFAESGGEQSSCVRPNGGCAYTKQQQQVCGAVNLSENIRNGESLSQHNSDTGIRNNSIPQEDQAIKTKVNDKNPSRSQHSLELRGASGFAQSYSDCFSVAGTASVTLSMAMLSDKEDTIDHSSASVVYKQLEMKEHVVKTTETISQQCSSRKDNEISNTCTTTDERSMAKQVVVSETVVSCNEAEKDKAGTKLAHHEEPLTIIETMVTMSRDVIGKDKRIYEFKPERCSTPCHGDVIPYKVAMATGRRDITSHNELRSGRKQPERCSTPYHGDAISLTNKVTMAIGDVKTDVISNNEISGEVGPSTPKTNDVRTEGPQMSLGKNTHVLSGLLKALQREKLNKDSTTKNCGLQPIPDSEGLDQTPSADPRPQPSESETVTVHNKIERRKNVVGRLKVCLFYNNSKTTKPVLYVTVLKASSLRQEFVQVNEDLYIQMRVSTRDDNWQQTKSVSTLTNTAVFNHLFRVPDITMRELEVSVIKLVLVSGHSNQEEAIAKVPLSDLVTRDKIKKTYLLKRADSQKLNKINERDSSTPVPVGAVHLGLKYNSVDEKLLVNVTKARGLPSMSESGETDPYVILTVKDDGKVVEEKTTPTQWNQRNPQFDANFVLKINRDRIGTTSLLVRVMNNSANHCLIGAVKIGMESVEDSGRHHWGSVLDRVGVHEERWHKLLR